MIKQQDCFFVYTNSDCFLNNLFTTRSRTPQELQYVKNNVFGIDFSEKSVRVGRMLNIIAGDGHTNVIELNSLDYPNWKKAYTSVDKWQDKYHEGFSKLSNMSAHPTSAEDKEKYSAFLFDILMANPPFAGDLDNKEQLEIYNLGYNAKGKLQHKVEIFYLLKEILIFSNQVDGWLLFYRKAVSTTPVTN